MKTVTYKLHRSDYSVAVYCTVQSYLVMASKLGYVTEFKAYSNFSEITSSDFVYNDLMNLINR